MVLLKEPDENRLWLVIAVLLGVAVVLLFASFQTPWYTASLQVGGVHAHSYFDFEDAAFEVYVGDRLEDSMVRPYSDASAFGDLMDRVGVLVGLGTFAAVALGVQLFSHYRGWWSHPKLIALSWLIGVGGIAAGIVHFTFSAARAGADEIQRLASMYNLASGRPQEQFWGTQSYAGGELVSAPGVGWVLAILAMLNLAVVTLLLYQFPATEARRQEEEVASFEVLGAQEESGVQDRPFSAAGGSSGRF
jgi:hypothetical protein